jgi:hypothetical protein
VLILFPKRKGVKIATTLIFEEMQRGASFHYLLGMITFARRFGAITIEEEKGLLDYLAATR